MKDAMDNIAVVVLAAGKGTRMLPLTLTTPKPMLKIGTKNLIEHKLELLPSSVTEIVLVIGYLGEQFREYFGDVWRGKKISYAVQREQDGTAGALIAAKEFLPQRFMVMMGDDLYTKEDVENLLAHRFAISAVEVENKEIGGEILRGSDGSFMGMHEARHHVESGLVNTGLYMLDRSIFEYPPQPIGGSSTEYGLPHTLALLARDIPVEVHISKRWFQVSSPDDLKRAESFLK